jgi:hypothetical protein
MCSTASGAGDGGVATADTALTTALRDGVEHLTHDQSSALLGQLRTLAGKVDALTLALVGKVDADGTHTYDGCLTTGAWVRAVGHQTLAEAARTVRTARTLRTGVLPNTSAALAAGAISGRHAAVIADGVKDAPAGAVALIEPEAVATAAEGDVAATANLMRGFQHALDPDKADERALKRYERAGITLSPLLDGGFSFAGTADETTGAAVKAALEAASELTTGDTRTAARRRLDGLHRICLHWLDNDPSNPDTSNPDTSDSADPSCPDSGDSSASPDSPGSGDSGDSSNADSAGTAADSSGTAGRTGDPTARRTSKSRARLIVTLDAHGLLGHTSPGGTLTWAGPITAATAQRLGCDASLTFVTLDQNGNVVEARSQQQFFTNPQRLAMIARDGDTCCAPFCDRPAAWSDGHHLTPRAHGGPTTIANGALPCEAHHLQLHEGHWRLQRLPDGRYLMRHRDGRTLGPEPPRPGHNKPPPAEPPDK